MSTNKPTRTTIPDSDIEKGSVPSRDPSVRPEPPPPPPPPPPTTTDTPSSDKE